MADETEQDKGFKISDRRTSVGAEGSAGSSTGNEPGEGRQGGEPPESATAQEATEVKVDFSTFLLSLLSSVLIQLGDMPDPITRKVQKDLNSAKHTIDILDILKEKTKGNLNEEEDRLLRNATAELKWKYLDAIKKNG